jgi:hypothetical protein
LKAAVMARKPRASLTCKHCGEGFTVPAGRAETARFCSRACADAHPKPHHMVRCRECGSLFQQKKSQAERNKIWGSFCSDECSSKARSRLTAGELNPNWRGRNFDSDGYRIYTPAASLGLGLGRIKVHHAQTFLKLGIKKLPAGTHVHHRDCDQLNNSPKNLVLMTISDHKWLHKQYGTATLRAVAHGLLSADEAASWSDDPLRALSLLVQDLESQAAIFEYLKSTGKQLDVGRLSAMKAVKCEIVEEEITQH